MEVLENEIEHSYKIHYDTELKELKILKSPRLELRLNLRSEGKSPKILSIGMDTIKMGNQKLKIKLLETV